MWISVMLIHALINAEPDSWNGPPELRVKDFMAVVGTDLRSNWHVIHTLTKSSQVRPHRT